VSRSNSYLFIGMLLVSLPGCLIRKDPLPALWFYTYSEGPANGRDSLLTPACFLELRPDGSYTRDFGNFEYGSWTRRENELYLTNQRHKTHGYQLISVFGTEMQMTTDIDLSDKVAKANFESQSLPAKSSEDPFSLDNNRCRLPATRKESDQEIRRRLYNHCRFWEAYFAWALNNDISTVDVRSTPTPIEIYGNGFGLKPFDELPDKWKAYFYDDEDCQKANALLKDIFTRQNIAWANTDNRFKMFIGAFQQLEKFLQ
jgi:hypothetical protein